MSAILDAAADVIVLSFLPWLLIMVPTSSALAYRLNWRPGVGAALGLVPVPFLSWFLVWAWATRGNQIRGQLRNVDPEEHRAQDAPGSSLGDGP